MADDSGEITTKYCSTCKQDVPSGNFEMHVVHCQRFLTLCPRCGESVNKRQLQEHIDENHAEVKCDACSDRMEKMELETHKTSSCRQRNVNCKYCEITLLAIDIDEHTESCGSRTEECDNCRKRILVKDLENHIASGCQMPVKVNDKPGPAKPRMPERLVGASDPFGNGMDDHSGVGFHVHPQFNPTYSVSSDELMNPYFQTSDYKPYDDHFNDELPKRSSPLQTIRQKKFTPTSTVKPFMREEFPFQRPRDKSEAMKTEQLFDVKSRGGTRKPNVIEPDSRKTSSTFAQPRWVYDHDSSDSDTDDMLEEKKTFPDLTDETLLPCEFCDDMFPADSLGFHQANCDNVPPTPRVESPPKFKHPPRDTFMSRPPPFETFSYQNEAAALPSNGSHFRRNTLDIGEGSAPCEFCQVSFPLVDLALHQVTCSQNPNLHLDRPPEQRSTTPPPSEIQQPRPLDTPKSVLQNFHPPQGEMVKSESPADSSRTVDVQSKTKASLKSSPNVQAREKRQLAPNFTGQASLPAAETKSMPPPKIESSSGATNVEKKPLRRNKPKTKASPTKLPQSFREVNVLGSERSQEKQANPFEHANGASFKPRSFGPNAPSNTKYPYQRYPRANNHLWNTRGNPRAGGQNPTRGPNTRGPNTRGRSGGSSTVTVPRRRYNQRQVSGIETAAADVSPQPDLALHGQSVTGGRNRDVTRPRMQGPGQRLGSGEPRTRSRRILHPPVDNNWDEI